MRDTTRPLPRLPAARAVFDLSLDGMLWSRKSLLMVLLLALPILFGVLYRAVFMAEVPAHISGFDLYSVIVARYYIRNVLPLAALFYATSLVSDDVEAKTITYLLSRPVPRASILLGKFAAYLATTLFLCLPSTVVTFFLLVTARGSEALAAAVPDLLRDLGAMALALLSYGSLFALMGVSLRRPVVPGLLFLFGWEVLANLPGYLPRLTITAYLLSLIRHRPAEEGLSRLFGQVLPAELSLQVLAAVVLVCLGAAVRVFSKREYLLEQ